MLNTQRLSLLAWDNLGVGIKMFITTRDKHYFDEDNIDIGSPINAHVVAVVNQVVELTAEEKAQAHREAMQRAQEEAYRKMTQPTKKKPKTTVDTTLQPSLFDL